MFKKRVFSLILAVILLVVWVVPAAADKPDMWKETFPPMVYPVVDCSIYSAEYDFVIWNSWVEEDIFHYKYDNDGNLNYMFYNAHMTSTFSAIPDTGKVLTSYCSDMAIVPDLNDTIMDIRGTFQKIIIPGVGPIFQDSGRKVFEYTWHPDGSLTFDLIFNAGPSSYTSNNFELLCAALAP